MVKNIKDIPIKELNELFKHSVVEAATELKVNPRDLRRDEYVKFHQAKNSQPRLSKDGLQFLGGFKYALNLAFPESYVLREEREECVAEKDSMIQSFLEYVKENNKIPTLEEFEQSTAITKKQFKSYFNSVQEIFEEAILKDNSIKDAVFNEADFTKDYYENVKEQIKKHKRFIITTAVSGKKVHKEFFKTLKNYADRNDALILVLPSQDVFNRKALYQYELDSVLKKDTLVIYRDTYLNNNLFISDIKVSAKQLSPLTGLARLAQRGGSMIMASTKLFLEYVPQSNEKIPLALMSTGAVTENDYFSDDYYMTKRLSKLGESDHCLSAIVVEIEDEEIFHFRQLQYCTEGCVIDLGCKYNSNGSLEKIENIVAIFGDVHASLKDDEVHRAVKEIVSVLGVTKVLLHDIADCGCVSHHTQNKPVVKATNIHRGQPSTIIAEGRKVVDYITDIGNSVGDIVIVYSNHDYFLQRYVEEGRFIYDPINLEVSLDLCKAVIKGENPLKVLVEDIIGLPKDIKVSWLTLDEDYKICGIQCANHGHLSSGGSKGSVKNLERCYKKVFSAHSHTPCIWRESWSVGTLSLDKMGYNHGPSTWIKNVGLIYPPYGTRQLVNFIDNNGTYTWTI